MSDFSFTDWKWRAYISNSHHIEFCDESHRLSRWRWKKVKTKKREKRSPHVWFNGFILCYAQSCGQECRIDHSSTDAATNSNYNRRRKQRQPKTMKQKKKIVEKQITNEADRSQSQRTSRALNAATQHNEKWRQICCWCLAGSICFLYYILWRPMLA